MNLQKLETIPPPPGVIGSLRAGFDAVSRRVVLILFPLALDVALWLGPRLGVNEMLAPSFRFLMAQTQSGRMSPEDAQRLIGMQELLVEALERFNLLSLLGKLFAFPVGVSSLLSGIMPVATPLGDQIVMQISSLPGLMGLMFLFILVGWIVGGLYFRSVSGIALGEKDSAVSLLRAIFQTIVLSVIWFIGLMMLSIPVIMLVTVLGLFSPALANGAIFVLLMLSFWLIVPLFFTPHGIFLRGQNAFYSIAASVRMARFTLPTSGMFVLSVILLYRGLNYLWSVPPGDSWMMLIGIFGHAFITTALLAASFVYYRDVHVWLKMLFERVQQKQPLPGRQA